jgi:hypothetical protein
MTAHIISFAVREGNGAREALIGMLESWPGFKVVPLEDDE